MRSNNQGIQSYVNYLLEDIQQAKGNVNELNFVRDESDLLDHFMEMERMVLEEPLKSFGEICGLTREQFPPAGQLSKIQNKKIARAFLQLLNSWNIDVVIPKKFPQENRYDILVPLLDKKVHILKKGMTYIEFCEYEPKECPFGSYCDCINLWDKKDLPKEKPARKSKSSSPEE